MYIRKDGVKFMKKITAVMVGAGRRGTLVYADYAIKHPHELQFVAVAEPNKENRLNFQRLHNIPDEMCFESWEELLQKPRLADAVLICTQDDMHFKPAVKAMEQNYHILLEKPMSPNLNECITLGDLAKNYNKVFAVCHVLRYTNFFNTIKKILDEGKIGRLISIQHNENVGYFHQAHSFVRGNWRNSKQASPMILAKSCHDMDIISWLTDSECEYISSFGELTYFKSENAPKGSAKRCIECTVEAQCPYSAIKIYLCDNPTWVVDALSLDRSRDSLYKAIKEGPYGRCVFHCDNDMVDHQVVNMKFKNDVTVSFTMCGFTYDVSRTIKLMGTKGEICGHLEKGEVQFIDFLTGNKNTIKINTNNSGHGGGDTEIIRDFVKLVREDNINKSKTSVTHSIQSHIMALAAEKARLEKKVINISEMIKN